MNKLRLMQVKQETLDSNYGEYFTQYKDKVFVCMGEFEHASGHILLCEFGSDWAFSGMHDLCDWEFIDQHPGDVCITIPIEDDNG